VKNKAAKIDWDTVELVGRLTPVPALQTVPVDRPLLAPPHLKAKQILSGAAAKARARGSLHTHTKLRKIIPDGLETLIYGWWLVTAALEADRDLARGIEIAANAIISTSQLFVLSAR